MGAFIFKQPNGRYGRFSSIVDCPTDINMTEEDYINYCMEHAKEEAIKTLYNNVKPFQKALDYFIPNNMTSEEFAEVVIKMNAPESEDLKWEEL